MPTSKPFRTDAATVNIKIPFKQQVQHQKNKNSNRMAVCQDFEYKRERKK